MAVPDPESIATSSPTPLQPPPPKQVEDDDWRSLSKAVRVLWRIELTIWLIVPALVAGGLLLQGLVLGRPILAWGGGCGALLLISGAIAAPEWYTRKRYQATRYRLAAQCLEYRRGLVWQVRVAIPLTRIQHVDLHSGPIDRRLDIVKLRIFTGGTKDVTHEIHGLETAAAEALRDRLIEGGRSLAS